MASQFQCPHCSGLFQVDASMGGTQVACPHCHGTVGLPPAEAPESHWGAHGWQGQHAGGADLGQTRESPVVPPAGQEWMLHCPVCQGMFQIPPELAGHVVACPHCQSAVQAPVMEQPAWPGTYPNWPPAGGGAPQFQPEFQPAPPSYYAPGHPVEDLSEPENPEDFLPPSRPAVDAGAGPKFTPAEPAPQPSTALPPVPAQQPPPRSKPKGARPIPISQKRDLAQQGSLRSGESPPASPEFVPTEAPPAPPAAPSNSTEWAPPSATSPTLASSAPAVPSTTETTPTTPTATSKVEETAASLQLAPANQDLLPPGVRAPARRLESHQESPAAERERFGPEERPAGADASAPAAKTGRNATPHRDDLAPGRNTPRARTKGSAAPKTAVEDLLPPGGVLHHADRSPVGDDSPSHFGDLPASVDDLPPGVDEPPAGTSDLPTGVDDLPPAVDDTSTVEDTRRGEGDLLPPGASPRRSRGAGAELPPGLDDEEEAGPSEQRALPDGAMLAAAAKAPSRTRDGSVLLTTEDGQVVALREPVRTVGKGLNERELHTLSAEERTRKRFVKNLVVWTFGIVVILVTIMVLMSTGPLGG